MLRSISSRAFAHRASLNAASRRELAIKATVNTAPDTSAQDFPAPSHVSLAAEARGLAKQFRDFYSNPDSSITLSDEMRVEMLAEITKRANSIPETKIPDEWIARNVKIPEKIRLGDNPLFKAYEADRKST